MRNKSLKKKYILLALCITFHISLHSLNLFSQTSNFYFDNVLFEKKLDILKNSGGKTIFNISESTQNNSSLKNKYSDELIQRKIKNIKSDFDLTDNLLIEFFFYELLINHKATLSHIFGIRDFLSIIFHNELEKHELKSDIFLLPAVISAYNPVYLSENGVGLWRNRYIFAITNNLTVDDYYDYRFSWYYSTIANIQRYAHLKALYKNNGDKAVSAFLSSPVLVNNKQNIEHFPIEVIYELNLLKTLVILYHLRNDFNINPSKVSHKTDVDTLFTQKRFQFSDVAALTQTDLEDLLFLNPVFKNGTVSDTAKRQTIVLPKSISKMFLNNLDSISNMFDSIIFTATDTTDIKTEKKADSFIIHTVKRGETLSGIVYRYSNVSLKEVMDLNGLSSPDRIRDGQKLKIPNKQP